MNIPSSTRDFVVGQEVQYCPDGTANGQILRATVTAVTKAPGVVPQVQGPHSLTKPGGNTFEIALHDDSQARLVVADESLAPCIDAGTSMLLFGTGKPEPEVVRIEEVCASSWPPKYLVKRPDGGVAEVEDYELAPVNAINVPPTADSSEDGKVSGVASETRAGASQKGVIWSLVNYDDGEEEEGEGEEEKAEVRKVHDQEHGAKDDATLRGTLERVSLVQGAVPSVHTAEPLVPPSIAKNDESYPASYVNEEARAFASAPPEPVVVLPTVARGSQAARIDSRTTARENSYSVPLNVVVEAQKATKSASSALSFDDVDTAVKYLRRALQLLTSSSPE